MTEHYETQKNQTPAEEMKRLLDVRINLPEKPAESKYLAKANLSIGGMYVVRGIKVLDSKNGPFVAMPSYRLDKDKQSERKRYYDIFFPITPEARAMMNSLVMEAYHQALQEQSAAQVNHVATAEPVM